MQKAATPATLEMEVKEKSFYLGNKPFFMFSGEIHYFRIPVRFWKEHIARAKEAGLNTVSFYIPWNWHEYEEGKFDFTGQSHPQRNLVKFLDMVKASGLYCSARVGPVSNAELVEEGIPKWMLEKNPDMYVQRRGFNNLPHALLLSYLNPKFQSYVDKWYQQILPIVSKYQVSAGGNIIMVQLCNEISMIHWLHKAYDESSFVNSMYREFLQEKYSGISNLNKSYSANYGSFEEVNQPKGDVVPEKLNIFFDWALFYRKYYALYFNSLYQRARSNGITLPLSANIPQFYDYDVRGRGVFSPMTSSMFRDFSKYSPSTVFGGAYQMRRLDFENFHDIVITTEVTKLLDPDAPTICAELQTGIMRDRPRLYPSDVELNLKTSAAHGLNGLNCYMFSSGENISGMGAFGAYHDWQAPVSLNGKDKKDHFQPLKEWGSFIRKFGSDLADTKKTTDTTMGFYLPYYSTEYFTGSWSSSVESYRTYFFYDGFARLIQLAGYNYSFLDLMNASLEDFKKHPSLCLFSLEFMDEETQSKLASYVENGGKLLIGPKIPCKNLAGLPCEILAQALGISSREKSEKEFLVWRGKECFFEFPIQTFNGRKSQPLIKTVSGLSSAVYGEYGKGKWVAYGFGMQHIFDYLVDMTREWFQKLGVQSTIKVEPWDIHAVLRWNESHGFLFLFNYHDVDKKAKVEILKKGFSKTVVLKKRSGTIIPLKLVKNKLVEVRK